jgi:ABC-type multidrug transport system fused ATPase/permease subunit
MIRFLYRNLEGQRWLVAVAITLTFVSVACDVLMAFPLKFVLDKIVDHRDPEGFLVGSLVSGFDRLTGADPSTTGGPSQLGVVLFAGALALTLGGVGALASFVELRIATRIGQETGARLRRRIFLHLEHLTLSWHGRKRIGDLVQRITGNVTDIEKLVTDGLVDLLSGILLLLGILAVMLSINWQFTVLSMFVAPPMFAVVLLYTRWIKKASKETARAAGRVAQVGTESINAMAEIKAYTVETWMAFLLQRQSENQCRAGLRAGRRQAEFSPLVLILVTISNVVIITVGALVAGGQGESYSVLFLTIPTGSLTIGSLTVFLAYSKLLYQPMRDLSKLMLLGSTAASAAERIQEILDEPRETVHPLVTGGPSPEPRGDLVIEHVVFGHGTEPVLRGVDLEIKVGTRLALVGLSGAGKTTLARLLPRFYEPWSGRITLGGADIRSHPLDELRRNIALVQQDSILLEGTIRDNIALGRLNATDGEVRAAAEQASLHDTIARLPAGYYTKVSEQGRNLSTGQRQRIAIARAFLRDAPILILDEPTASLDAEAEAEVMSAIARLTAGRTVILISHRLSTLDDVDAIAVLGQGRITECGTYAQLSSAGGPFARLLARQNSHHLAHGAGAAGAPSRRLRPEDHVRVGSAQGRGPAELHERHPHGRDQAGAGQPGRG